MSLYPLDQNRTLLKETKDSSGVIRKLYKLTAKDGSELEVEYEIHPTTSKKDPSITFPSEPNTQIVFQEMDSEGKLSKLVTADNKEYFVQEKLPSEWKSTLSKKRKATESLENSGNKKSKTYSLNPQFLELLLHTKVHDLPNFADGGIHVLVALRTQSAKDVFRSLLERGFLSCPVVNSDGISFKGFIDLMDYVRYFIQEVSPKSELRTEQVEAWSLLEKQSLFDSLKVKDLIKQPSKQREFIHPLRNEYSVYSALEILALEKHLHRIPIMKDKSVVNVITQSALIDFITKNLNLLGSIKDKPLSEIPELFHFVCSITHDCHAIEAFKLLYTENVTGVAVVEKDNGKLIGNISIRDLKGIDMDGKFWSRLFTPALEYLASMQEQFPSSKRPKEAVFALPTDTLGSVLTKISTHKIHRVYVVNNETERKPIGVAGLKELLHQILLL